MPDSCCIVNCSNRRVGNLKDMPFYRLPKGRTPIEKRKRKAWIAAIDRKDWEGWTGSQISHARVCGAHFISGRERCFIFLTSYRGGV